MRSTLTADDLFVEILMLRGADDRVILLVEGVEDCGSLDAHIRQELAYTLPGHGKNRVLGAMQRVSSQGLDRVIALVDLDWDGILGDGVQCANVYRTDLYDLDATVYFAPGVVHRVIHASCASTRNRQLPTRTDSLATAVADLVFPLGVLRKISEQHRLGLKLRDFPLDSTIDWNIPATNNDRLVDIALRRSPECPADKEALGALLAGELPMADGRSIPRYCCGHDLLRALSAYLRKVVHAKVNKESIALAFRAALDCGTLNQTRFYSEMTEWSVNHVGSSIWSCLSG